MFKQIYGVIVGGISIAVLASVGFLVYQRVQSSEVS